MCEGDLAGQAQPDPGSVRLGRVERPEDAGSLLRVDVGAAVLHLHDHLFRPEPDRQIDPSVRIVAGDYGLGGDGLGLWVQGLQSTGLSNATTERARLHANRTGVIGGVDYTAGAPRIGGFGGYQDDRVTLRGRASSAKIDTAFAGANVAWDAGP